jgi:hypothetical protein
MGLSELYALTVGRFPGSVRRPLIFAEFERLVDDLNKMNVVCELWTDGSFLTEKLEPDDIDLSFAAFAEALDRLNMASVAWIFANLDDKNYSSLLHTYVCVRFARDDPRRAADRTDYWTEKWGVGWDDRLKGYVVIKLGETDVGHKLCT